MPQYDLSDFGEVRLAIFGSVVDEAHASLLMKSDDLSFEEALALDRVQEGLSVPDGMLGTLRRKELVEGRRPGLGVCSTVAEATGTGAEYVERRGRSDECCMALICDELLKRGPWLARRSLRCSCPAFPPATP